MVLENLLKLLEMMEEKIGNHASVMIGRSETGLVFKIFWPDGYRLSHKVDSLDWLEEEIFVLFLIDKAKKAHPQLMSTIS